MGIQIAISNSRYADALRNLLARSGAEAVVSDRPDLNRGGLVILGPEHLELLPAPLKDPDRVVLVTRKGTDYLSRAWEIGINTVIFDNDPLNTAVLAIMSARLRVATGSGVPDSAEAEMRPRLAERSTTGDGSDPEHRSRTAEN